MKDDLSTLTEGEMECLRLVHQGYSSKQIVRLLTYPVSMHTVDQRLRTAMRKLHVTNRQEAARLLAAAEADRPYQPLIYQHDRLAPADQTTAVEPSATRGWPGSLLTKILAPPPIGGHENDLSWVRRNIEIIRIATLGIATLIGLVLTVAGALSAFT